MPPKFQKINKNSGNHEISECDHKVQGSYIHYKPKCAKEGKNIVCLRESNDMRDIIIPNAEPQEGPGILPKSEFLRLRKQAHVLTAAEKKQIKDDVEKKKNQDFIESNNRKEAMKQSQLEQNATKGSILDEVEKEAAKKNQYLLQRAHDLQLEQEDEIKGANRIILASKCLAVREAQIREKRLIEKEMEQEEKRLDRMMEQQRQIGLREDKMKRDKEEERNQNFVSSIKQQLKEVEILQHMEAERKEEEARSVTNALIQMQHEERQLLEEKKLKRLQCQAELKKANEDQERYRALEREEERLADIRLKEFMRQKEEREELLAKEAHELKMMKEREITRLREIQQHAADMGDERETMNAFRVHEEEERKWRKKEMDAALKKKQDIEQLKRDRKKQIDDIKRNQALEQARDEEEFHKVATLQYGIFLREKEKIREKREKADRHRRDILKQVNEHELHRIELRKNKMDEGQAVRLEQEMRNRRINETVQKKIDNLRNHDLPEKTLNDINRQIKTQLSKAKY